MPGLARQRAWTRAFQRLLQPPRTFQKVACHLLQDLDHLLKFLTGDILKLNRSQGFRKPCHYLIAVDLLNHIDERRDALIVLPKRLFNLPTGLLQLLQFLRIGFH